MCGQIRLTKDSGHIDVYGPGSAQNQSIPNHFGHCLYVQVHLTSFPVRKRRKLE